MTTQEVHIQAVRLGCYSMGLEAARAWRDELRAEFGRENHWQWLWEYSHHGTINCGPIFNPAPINSLHLVSAHPMPEIAGFVDEVLVA